MSFLLVHSKIFSSLPASAKPSIGHISSRKPVVPCGRIVVSSLHCGCSKPGLNPGQVKSSQVKLSFIVIPLHVWTYSGTRCRASQDHGAT